MFRAIAADASNNRQPLIFPKIDTVMRFPPWAYKLKAAVLRLDGLSAGLQHVRYTKYYSVYEKYTFDGAALASAVFLQYTRAGTMRCFT